jgi:hypothetical protein
MRVKWPVVALGPSVQKRLRERRGGSLAIGDAKPECKVFDTSGMRGLLQFRRVRIL